MGDTVDLTKAFAASAAAMKAKKTFTFAGDAGEGSMSGQMRVDGDDTALKIQTTMEGQSVDILLIGGVLYMGGLPNMPAGKTFVMIDPEGDDSMSTMMGPALSQMAKAADPTSSLAGVEGLKAKVMEVQDGTTTYEATMSADQQLSMARKRLEEMGMGDTPMPTPSVMKPLTLRQAIEADNLPTRIELAGGAEMSMTLSYSGWGEPVDVVAPPADKVATFADVM